MKKIQSLVLCFVVLAALVGCDKEEKSPSAPVDESSTSTEATKDAVKSVEESAGSLLGDAAPAQKNAALEKIGDISQYSEVLTKGWDSIKGLGFDQKSELLQQLKSIISKAGSNIGALKQVAPMLGGDTGKALIGQLSGLTGNLDTLKSLYAKGQGVASGDWGSYKDQIGSAVSSLAGGFSGLSSILK